MPAPALDLKAYCHSLALVVGLALAAGGKRIPPAQTGSLRPPYRNSSVAIPEVDLAVEVEAHSLGADTGLEVGTVDDAVVLVDWSNTRVFVMLLLEEMPVFGMGMPLGCMGRAFGSGHHTAKVGERVLDDAGLGGVSIVGNFDMR